MWKHVVVRGRSTTTYYETPLPWPFSWGFKGQIKQTQQVLVAAKVSSKVNKETLLKPDELKISQNQISFGKN